MIDDDIERRLGQGIRHRDADQLAREIEQADLGAEKKRITAEELEAARERQEDLEQQIERCRSLLAASRAWTGFEAAPFRDALSSSLELLGAGPLTETTDDEGRRVWSFPPLDRRAESGRHDHRCMGTLFSSRLVIPVSRLHARGALSRSVAYQALYRDVTCGSADDRNSPSPAPGTRANRSTVLAFGG